LLRPGDRVRFHRVDEDELMELFEDVRADRYVYEIDERPFDVGAHIDLVARLREESEERERRREEASAATPVP
jgi:urea carboxylase